jgi:hypothetical protein
MRSLRGNTICKSTDQSDEVRSIATQSITSGDQSYGLIGTIDRNAIDSKN